MQRLNIPEAIAQHPAVQSATDAYNTLVAEHGQARAALARATRGLPSAQEADKRAWATALTANAQAKDPGQKETDRAQRDIHQANRRLEALSVAVADAEAAVHGAISEHHGDLMATVGERITNSQHALNDALDALDTHLRAWTTARMTAQWLRNFPEGGRLPATTGYVPALAPRQRNTGQTAASVDEVVTALRDLLKPPETPGTTVGVAGSMAAFLGVEQE